MVRRPLAVARPRPAAAAPALHVILCTDRAYARGAGVALLSVARANPALALEFHLVTGRLPRVELERFARTAAAVGAGLTHYRLDERGFAPLRLQGHFTQATFYRFVALELLPDSVARALYLDSDVVCLGALDGLLALDLAGAVAAARPECDRIVADRVAALGLPAPRYFNAGVLLVDVPAWRRAGVAARALALLAAPPVPLKFNDQDALNLLFADRLHPLAPEWNVFYNLAYDRHPVPPGTVLLHYLSSSKPWQAWCDHPARLPYARLVADSEWRSLPPVLPRTWWEIRLHHAHLRARGENWRARGWLLPLGLAYLRERLGRRGAA